MRWIQEERLEQSKFVTAEIGDDEETPVRTPKPFARSGRMVQGGVLRNCPELEKWIVKTAVDTVAVHRDGRAVLRTPLDQEASWARWREEGKMITRNFYRA